MKFLLLMVPVASLMAWISFFPSPAHAESSELWGDHGEKWSSKGRLPDFSFAGYRAGDVAIPTPPVTTNVKNFGATGDGLTDDTTAFLKALGSIREGVIMIPEGRYKLTQQIKIRRRGVILRGDGIDKTVLLFPKSLSEVTGSSGNWSWSGGMISFEGWDNGNPLADITAPAMRGDTTLSVSSTVGIHPGQWVRVVLTDPDGSLARHLHGEQKEGAKDYHGRKLIDFASPVESVSANALVLKRSLRNDVRLNWKPALFAQSPSIEDVGVEDLTIEFPGKQYIGHHAEPGYNAISFEGVCNGWARRLHIVNADSGLFFRGHTKFCTAEAIHFSITPGRLKTGYGTDKGEPQTMPVGGHHGILIIDSSDDNLVQDFQIDFRFIHDLSVSAWAAGNVFSKGRAVDMDFDQHRRAPYANLFTQMQAGIGTRLWQSGGDLFEGPSCGAWETFWNIQTDRLQSAPEWSIEGNFIGVSSVQPAQNSETGTWWEPVLPAKLQPSNLYEAQLKRRSNKPSASE